MRTLGIICIVLAALAFIFFIMDWMNGVVVYNRLIMAILFTALGLYTVHRYTGKKSGKNKR